MMQDEQLIKKRFLDLFQQAQRKGIVCFSDFLTLNEQNILNSCAGSLGITYELSGGCFYAERQIAAFLPLFIMNGVIRLNVLKLHRLIRNLQIQFPTVMYWEH